MWNSYCGLPSIYIPRAYQSPCSGMDCGSQCAHAPNLASRHHAGAVYWRLSVFQSGVQGPGATGNGGRFQMSGCNSKLSPTAIRSILTPTSSGARLMVTVALVGIVISIEDVR